MVMLVHHMVVIHVTVGRTGVMDGVLSALMVHQLPNMEELALINVGTFTAVRIYSQICHTEQ